MTRTLLSNARIFDAVNGEIADGDVVIEDGRIADVGPGLDGDESVDLDGRALLPGLIDCHTHFMVNDVDLFGGMQRPFSLAFHLAAKNTAATVDAGITSVRDAGGSDLGLKTAVDTGLIRGPHMQISLGMISQTGGHGDPWMVSGQHLRLFVRHPGVPETIVDGVEEIRAKVRELVRMGADVIKVATSGGVLSPRDDPKHAHFSPEELEMLVETARGLGVWVMAHAQAYDGIKNGIRAGIRSIDHGIYLDDEAIEMMIERGTFLVPTLLAPTGVLRAAEAGASIPEASLQKARDVIEVHMDSFSRAAAAGVKVAMGTDSGVTPHGENLGELALMEKEGMSPADVLMATTRVAAECMDVADDRGTIEPGKRADLVVIDGDPFQLEAIRDRVAAVYKDGALISGGVEG